MHPTLSDAHSARLSRPSRPSAFLPRILVQHAPAIDEIRAELASGLLAASPFIDGRFRYDEPGCAVFLAEV